MIVWNILTGLAAFCLIIFFKGKSATWGGFTFGALIGFAVCLILFFLQDSFNWVLLQKILVCFVLTGTIVDLIWARIQSKHFDKKLTDLQDNEASIRQNVSEYVQELLKNPPPKD